MDKIEEEQEEEVEEEEEEEEEEDLFIYLLKAYSAQGHLMAFH